MQYLTTILLALFFLNAPATSASAQDHHSHPASEQQLQPGDKGFRHDEMHPHYQLLFGQGRCYCHTGECRPTVWQSASESPSGYQVKLNGEWVNVPSEAIQHKETVPPELWADPAHICAFYSNGRLVVECAIINASS